MIPPAARAARPPSCASACVGGPRRAQVRSNTAVKSPRASTSTQRELTSGGEHMATDDVGPTERVRDHVRSVLQRRVERSMAPTMLPYAIETAARADHERVPILLYCPR